MKKIIILLIPFLLTGCASVTYNLDIDKNLSVSEKVDMSATKDYFNNFYMNLPITIIKEVYNNNEWMKPLKENNYKYEIKSNSKYPSIYASKKYNNLLEYANNTIYKGQTFEQINIIENDNLITIECKDFIPYKPDDSDGEVDNSFPISNLAINIKVPYVVTKSNADKIDKKTNTYKWYINEETEDKEIKLTFDKNKIYIYNVFWYLSIIIIFIVFIVAIIFIIKIIKKNRKNNNIK